MYGASTATNSSSSSGGGSGSGKNSGSGGSGSGSGSNSHHTASGGAIGDDASYPPSTPSTSYSGMNHSHSHSHGYPSTDSPGSGYYGENTTNDGSNDSNNEEVSLDAINEHLNR